ncbi:hypothetical protein [Xanthobacter flavus]|uniref:hypothetical protein n=1 Tax=Xanthobacter flavus TaxID=281 RepID=UPI001AE16B51|nr:hypothetical protein [Xanthobacter flavus]MBP2147424.1 hypothetical protein [Xanthobacter flavus]
MLAIRIELWPSGDKSRARTIAEATVTNISGLDEVSDYQVAALETASDVTGLPARAGGFVIPGHPRKSTVWMLVAKVAMAAARRFTPDPVPASRDPGARLEAPRRVAPVLTDPSPVSISSLGPSKHGEIGRCPKSLGSST